MFNDLPKIKYYRNNRKRGMTLVELLVVISIFAVISGIILFDFIKFDSSVSLRNLANDIALSVRKAQSYAIGVRGISEQFKYGHGIHFSTEKGSTLTAGSQKSFILFTNWPLNETPPLTYNSIYDYDSSGSCGSPSDGNECQEILSINSADEISNIYLSSEENVPRQGILDIVFKRPNPDAIFCYREDTSGPCQSEFSWVKIEVSNGEIDENRKTRTITVWSTGQISTSQ
jgi:prepilin-type N-terminal cleavage/methylation domain-containing protein